MRRLLVAVFAVLPATAIAKEAFDIARFTVPPRWQKSTSPGLVTLQAPPTRGSGAQLFLFASEPARGSPEDAFRVAWQKLIAGPLPGLVPASTQAETSPDGWTAVTGVAPYQKGGATWRALLVSATGHGRTMNVVVHLLGQEHDGEVDAFFKDLDLIPPGGAAAAMAAAAPAGPATPDTAMSAPAGGSAEAAGISFTPPRGWARTTRADAVVYVSPPYPNTGEKCELGILPMRPGSGDLLRDAMAAFQGLFRGDPMRGYPEEEPQLVRGTSPLGWSYASIQKTPGPMGEGGPGLFVFVAGVGDQAATIFTTSKRPLVSQCFGEAFPSEWPPFFNSLRFKGVKPAMSDAEMKNKLAGSWTATGARVLLRYTLSTNGRYASGSAVGNVSRVSPTEVVFTTTGFRGDGAWTVKGQNLTLSPDGRAPEPGVFRLEQDSKDGRTWKDRLCIYGGTGDICYRRDP
jgi:hypothetical protein